MHVSRGNIVLGVCGSIASYRAADLARDLMRAGFTVRVCLTDSAQKFVTPVLFETLTGQPCLIDTFEEPERGRMAHLDWARRADLLLIAPASANTLNKLARGEADDMLGTIALAFTGPMVIAPAMNPTMYAHEATQEAMSILRGRAIEIVEPTEGDVVVGEHGLGKLAPNEAIVKAALVALSGSQILKGKKVLITSGPTQEPVDQIRFLSNRSSGKMGAALARAALLMGAHVTVVSGPTRVSLPIQAHVVPVVTAEQMMNAALAFAPEADLIIGAAAVADYRPAAPVAGKLRRGDQPIRIELIPNPDVLARLASAAKHGCVCVGFAAEPGADLETAAQKVVRKGLAAIAVNDVSQTDIGFDSDENELTLLFRNGEKLASGRRTKLGCALWLLEALQPQFESCT